MATVRTEDDFNNASTGLFKDNVAGDISAQDLRDFVASVMGSRRGMIDGLNTSNGTDTAHDIDIGVGIATVTDGSGNYLLAEITSTITKQIDAAWAVGTAAGGLDGTESVGGTPDASTWYHLWLIMRSDTGVVDVAFSENATGGPTLPTNYDFYRRIGAVLTDGSANIRQYIQAGDLFEWVTPQLDVNGASQGTTQVARTLSVAPIAGVEARMFAAVRRTGSINAILGVWNADLGATAWTPGSNVGERTCQVTGGTASEICGETFIVRVSSTGTVYTECDAASTDIWIATQAYTDPRGRVVS
jgi:hypothetical protein